MLLDHASERTNDGSINGAGIFVDENSPLNLLVISTSDEIRFKLFANPSSDEYNFKSISELALTTVLRHSGGPKAGDF